MFRSSPMRLDATTSIGRDTRTVTAREKLTGRAMLSGDLVAGHAAHQGAEATHARIVRIDTAAAGAATA